jgi:hypothetical protein
MPASVVPTNARNAGGAATGGDRVAPRAGHAADRADMPRIWSWPPARLWPPAPHGRRLG